MTTYTIATFYKFTPFGDIIALQARLQAKLKAAGIRGTVLLAKEGVNGTLAADSDAGFEAMREALQALPGCEDLALRTSQTHEAPFMRLKVRLKKEIVTMGVEGVDPNETVGNYVNPEDWNALISDPDTVLIDTRNDYEFSIGTFEGAIDPKTESFRDFPEWFRNFRAENPMKKVAMFCTGGIRCEKATSFVRNEGIEDVYHLNGGILAYLEQIKKDESLWNGECFVFDERVTVKHGLEPGNYDMCHACKHPLSQEEMQLDSYLPGVQCNHCEGKVSEERRQAFAQRQRQIELGKERGIPHMGPESESAKRAES